MAKWWVALSVAGLAAGCACVGGRKEIRPEDEERRAGYPHTVASWAKPSDTGRYKGYYVGGGSPCRGEGPCEEEGTWGWDYCGLCLPSKIALGWWHGRKEQGGTGAYKTDGPRLPEHEKE
jgi:hypothetical protein